MLELLSPAGSREAVTAAVQNGAGAVYLGFGDYNARRNAKNFTPEQFAEAVAYCHVRGIKVYLTLNTLLSDRGAARRGGAGALCLRRRGGCGAGAGSGRTGSGAPDGSGSAHPRQHPDECLLNLDGVKRAADLGCTRAVLARELSRDQIGYICAHSPIEIEVFGHGAQCMCYSGQCFFSSVIGGRSGNRGLCAQPCRLSYGLGRAGGQSAALAEGHVAGRAPPGAGGTWAWPA